MPNTTHFAIFDYWKDKYITKSGKVITHSEYVNSRGANNPVPVVLDWFEIQCWACGKIHRHETEIQKRASDQKDPFRAIWSDPETKSFYNRCHIIAKSLGGPDEPSNLFLLCPDCHVLSPDTANPESFFRWVYKKQKTSYRGWSGFKEIEEYAKEELQCRGYVDVDSFAYVVDKHLGEISNGNPLVGYEKFKEYAMKRVTSHESKISESSLICVACDFLEEMYKEAMGEDVEYEVKEDQFMFVGF